MSNRWIGKEELVYTHTHIRTHIHTRTHTHTHIYMGIHNGILLNHKKNEIMPYTPT